MKTQLLLIILLAILLAACAPAQLTPSVNATDAQNTSIAVVGTTVALTQTALPTATLLPATLTPTTAIMYPTPSPLPTNPPAIVITPDPIQVEKWQEYQTELAKPILFDASAVLPNYYEHSLCEWVILGRSGQEVYAYAVCAGLGAEGEGSAAIYLETDGSIRDVKVVFSGSPQNPKIQELFPEKIRELISLYYSYGYPGKQELYSHLRYRQTHRDVPPLTILSAMPTATPSP